MDKLDNLILNNKLRKTANLLVDEGITATYIAKKVGISVNTVSQWLRGNHNLTDKNIEKLKLAIDIMKPLLNIKL